jgi:hypothetical protein
VCKRGQQASDLFIRILLNSEQRWWENDGGLPIYDADAHAGPGPGPDADDSDDGDDDVDDDDTIFMGALWMLGQTRSVFDNFSAVLIQVKNGKQPRRGDVASCHDTIQKMAKEIFKMRTEIKTLHLPLYGVRKEQIILRYGAS